ncbi:sensor histidine kinase [Allorhizocola rhizosphaerae]|uniref:sensor histidine kinase n=1 Tax=Allorhizocola rhizosphaerae TaxID=1872709 RepID=UPI000E3C7C52|nr:histidine kinase [Allorhizocola rhizosphaerae]
MGWVSRLFEERYTFVRITLLNLSGVGYVVIRPDGDPINAVDWVIAIGAFLFGYVTIWSPVTVVIGVSAAIGVGDFFGADNDVIPTVALAWGLLELGMRRSGWQVWAGALCALAGCLMSDYSELLAHPVTAVFSVAPFSAPLLVGLQVRSLQLLNRQAAERAAQESTRVRAEERTNIARELHDLVAHHVASIVLRVGVARNVLPLDDPRVREVLDDVHSTASGALADLRRLVAVLRDPGTAQQTSFVDPEGLSVALVAAVERSRQIGLKVDADIDPGVIRLDSRTALAVLRLTQEGLANVAKHAGTDAQTRLSIRVDGDGVEFKLHDLGGFPPAAAQGGGHGLIGLRERVEVLGGTLQAGPLDSGWQLAARIPA